MKTFVDNSGLITNRELECLEIMFVPSDALVFFSLSPNYNFIKPRGLISLSLSELQSEGLHKKIVSRQYNR